MQRERQRQQCRNWRFDIQFTNWRVRRSLNGRLHVGPNDHRRLVPGRANIGGCGCHRRQVHRRTIRKHRRDPDDNGHGGSHRNRRCGNHGRYEIDWRRIRNRRNQYRWRNLELNRRNQGDGWRDCSRRHNEHGWVKSNRRYCEHCHRRLRHRWQPEWLQPGSADTCLG